MGTGNALRDCQSTVGFRRRGTADRLDGERQIGVPLIVTHYEPISVESGGIDPLRIV
jgi:hypothetical protein